MIPFNKPCLTGNELRYIAEAIQAGHSAGDGQFTKRCHSLLERELGVRKVLLTTSCTHALEMAALLLNLQPGDEVIVPSFTFVSTVNAFVLRGARPVFADIRSDTLNLDESQLDRLVTPRTRAVVPVHYAGVGCEMNTILDIAARHGLAVIEDNAHGLFGKYRGRNLGTFGALAAQSFHETKNFICGEGGALVINDPQYIERAEILREKGTNRSRFFRGEVDKYTWQEVGSSFLPSELIAAFLWAQLEQAQEITRARLQLWDAYHQAISGLEQEGLLRRPIVPAECGHNAHMYYVLLAPHVDRDAVLTHLKAQGIHSVFHYVPLHSSPGGQRYARTSGNLPVTDEASGRLVRLPLWVGLGQEDILRIVDTLASAIRAAEATAGR